MNFFLHEKSELLKNSQDKILKEFKFKNVNIDRLKNFKELKVPTFFICNEFFDSLPVNQFILKKNKWFEKRIILQNDKYKVIDFPKAISAKYNEHNQYLRYWLDSGVLSFLLFLFLIFFNFKRGFVNKDYSLISLCILLAIFSMTESCLIRQKGIIFFVFILCLYDKKKYNNLVT